ncbi:hypothetical protein BDW71DRAFT_210369 [Aspergillus fruticulosus]
MLELSKLTFPHIEALVQKTDGKWSVSERAINTHMDGLVEADNIPHSIFPNKIFATAAEYFRELALDSYRILHYQRTNALLGKHDWKEKYIARCMFRRIAHTIETEPGMFRLYCDDFSPLNISLLLGDNVDFSIRAITNWESTYAAPNEEFTYTAPWRLPFQPPHGWEEDLRQSKNNCTP